MLSIRSSFNKSVQIPRHNPPLLYLRGFDFLKIDELSHPILGELKLFSDIPDCEIAFRHRITPAQYHLTLLHIITYQKNKPKSIIPETNQ